MDILFAPSYGYDIELDSNDDDEDEINTNPQDSSDDEDQFAGDISIRKFVHEYEQRSNREHSQHAQGSDDENDLEKELDAELQSTVAALEKRRFQTEQPTSISESTLPALDTSNNEHEMDVDASEPNGDKSLPPGGVRGQNEGSSQDGGQVQDGAISEDVGAEAGKSEQRYYDDDYYDSDDDESETESAAKDSQKKSEKKKRPVISDDDLLYDPRIDEDNQKWMDEQRAKRRVKAKEKAPNSDALLDCPACLTTVCIDCQRHEFYEHQYRAIFVQNCVVDPGQTTTATSAERRKRKHGKKPVVPDDATSFPVVKCSECQTVVGAMDSEEIFYFFNVVASHT